MLDIEGSATLASASSAITLSCSLLPTASAAAGDSASASSSGEDALPVGLILTPLAPLPDDLTLSRDALRCSSCAAYIGPHCEVGNGTWTCGICHVSNRSLTLSGQSNIEAAHPELTEPVVEYVLRAPPRVERFVSASRITEGKVQPAPCVIFFLVDDTAGAAAMADVLAAVRAALPLLPPEALLGLLTFGRTVSIYLLGQGDEAASHGLAEALVLPAADAPVEWELAALRLKAQRKGESALAPRHACDSQLIRVLEALQPQAQNPVAALLKTAAPVAADGAVGGGGVSRGRGLIAAIDLALDVIGLWPTAKPPCGQLVVCGLAGPPNYGPGALPPSPRAANAMPPRSLARDAALAALRDAGSRLGRAGLSAFIACAGGASCDAEALRALALPCGGSVALARQPGSADASMAHRHALCDLFGGVGQRGAAGALTVRCSDGICVGQVVGSAVKFEAATDCAPDESKEDGVCFMGALHTTTCLSLTLDVGAVSDSSGAASHGRVRRVQGVVQAALRYTAASGEQRLRTYTIRAPITPNTQEWLGSVDVEVTVLLAARVAALAACAAERDTRDPASLSRCAAEVGAGWARLYGEPRQGISKGWLWNSSKTIGYDARHAPLPQLLRRLHLLANSPSALHRAADADAAHFARLLLLTAPPPLAKLVAVPDETSRGDVLGEDEEREDAGVASASACLAALSLSTLAAGGGQHVVTDGGEAHARPSLREWLDGIGVFDAGDD